MHHGSAATTNEPRTRVTRDPDHPILSALSRSVAMALLLGGPVTSVAESATEDSRTSDQATAPLDQIIEQIVVTGSRIPRAGFETLQPAMYLDSELLEMRNSIDLAMAINEQSGFATPANSLIDGQAYTRLGQNVVNFLGLGGKRTLTLVNGQRFATSGVADLAVDLNLIPDMLVDRVEVIGVGGAPIYGSDAIAGTVNIILKRDFEGLTFSGAAGGSPHYGDAGRFKAALAWGRGFDQGRGNIAFSVQSAVVDGLKMSDRRSTRNSVSYLTPADPLSPYSFVLTRDVMFAGVAPLGQPLYFGHQYYLSMYGNGIPLDITDPASPLAQFDRDGNLVPFIVGEPTGTAPYYIGGDGYHLPSMTSLYTNSERHHAALQLNYEITPDVRARAELWYSRTNITEVANQPPWQNPIAGGLPDTGYGNVGSGPIPVLIDNPFLTDATRTTILDALNVQHDFDGDGVADPTIDTNGDGLPDAVGFWWGGTLQRMFGDSRDKWRTDLYRYALAFEGELLMANRPYAWEINASYANVRIPHPSRVGVPGRIDQALQVTTDTTGAPACVDPSDGCVPLNILGKPSREAMRWLQRPERWDMWTRQLVVTATMAGDLADLPAGTIETAVGLAYREEYGKWLPEKHWGQSIIAGEFDSREVYAELLVPLLGGAMDTRFIDTLEFEGAIRYVQNSVAGSDKTWTAGVRYRPIRDIEFRGNRTESIRAPSITELFTGEFHTDGWASDPCDSRYIDQGNYPARRAANCAAAGIAQPFESYVVSVSQHKVMSGNPDLVNELARSLTYGVVVKPRFVAGLTVAVDWMEIKINNAIESLSATALLRTCYDSAAYPNEPACDTFTRADDGQIAQMSETSINVGLLEVAGLQTVISYETSIERFGELRFTLNHMHTSRLLERAGVGNAARLEGQYCCVDDRVTASVRWAWRSWNWFTQVRWLDDAVYSNSDTRYTRDVKGSDDWQVVDTSVAYSVNEHIRLQLNIDNLLNSRIPTAAVASGWGENTYFPGVMERYVTFSVRAEL